MHFDVSRNWVDDAFDVNGNGLFDFRTVALHEIGHALGLGHSLVGTVMAPNYAGGFRTLSADDIAGIQAIYGPAASTASVPEPASITLVGLGLLIIGGQARFSQRKKSKTAKLS